MRAQDALVDPLLTWRCRPSTTAYTGADALAQAIGGAIVSNGNLMSLAVGLEACRHVAAGLQRSVADGSDVDARTELSLGSLMAGLAMNLSDSGADHALGHAIGSTLGCARPHGRHGAGRDAGREPSACGGLLERVADALGEPDDGSGDGSRAVRAVRRCWPRSGCPHCARRASGRATSTAWWSSRSRTTA
jgi:alcohol dehydrogenase